MIKDGQQDINKTIANFISDEYSAEIEMLQKKVTKKRRELRTAEQLLKTEREDLHKAIKKAYSKTGNASKKLENLAFVERIEKNQNMIKVFTKELIVDKKYNLGKYVLSITKDSIKAYRIEGKVLNLHHCFVDKNANICYGHTNVEKSVRDWRKAGLYHLAVAVIWDILSNVPVGSKPYTNIKPFYNAIQERIR